MAKCVGLAVLLVALATRAEAQRAEADAAFERGRELMKSGDHAAACEAFEASLRFEATLGTLYNLGLCHEKLGKLATAYTELKQVAATDTNRGRAADAAKRAAALEPRLTRMKLSVAEPAPGLVVERDGLDVTTLVGQDVPVDPKTYTFTASAAGRKTYAAQVALDQEGATIEVSIPPLAVMADDPPPPAGPAIVATGYPAQLPLRPLFLPDGAFEASAGSVVATSDSEFEQTPIDGSVQARMTIQMFELGVAAAFHLRYAQAMSERPSPWSSVTGLFGYAITPTFVSRLAYTRLHPIGDRGNGSDLRLALTRKQLVTPRLALIGSGGFVYQDRDLGASVTELVGEASFGAQLAATDVVSFEGLAELGLNLGGDLYDHTTSLGVGVLALYAATSKIDAFARVFVGLLPAVDGSSSSDFRSYSIGLNWRR